MMAEPFPQTQDEIHSALERSKSLKAGSPFRAVGMVRRNGMVRLKCRAGEFLGWINPAALLKGTIERSHCAESPVLLPLVEDAGQLMSNVECFNRGQTKQAESPAISYVSPCRSQQSSPT